MKAELLRLDGALPSEKGNAYRRGRAVQPHRDGLLGHQGPHRK
jgi:hypothetical protein